MYCRNCGKQIPDDSKFCQNCGQDMEVVREVKINEPPNSSEEPKPIETTKPINIPTSIKTPPLPIMTGKSQVIKPEKAPKQNMQP